MNCPMDGILRPFVDGEMAGGQFNTIERHVQGCEPCQFRLSSLRAQASEVQSALNASTPEAAIDAHQAYSRYMQEYGNRPGRAAWINRLTAGRTRGVAGAFALAAALILILSFSPGRTWAQKILEMLRVQKIAVVPVDLSAIATQNGNGRGQLLAQFISDNVIVTMKPGPPTPVADAATAGQKAGFTVRKLDQLGTPQKVLLSNEGAFQMTLNRDRMQAVLDQVGRSDIQIPDSVDGSLIAVHVPKSVHLRYGSCEPQGSTERCIDFMQVPSPTISIPPGLNIAVLAEAGLQLAGMSAAEAHAFAQTVDWSSTLVIPVPQTGGSYRTVPVDGVNGTLIETSPRGNFVGRYELIWVKNGIVYSLAGKGTPDRALVATESLS